VSIRKWHYGKLIILWSWGALVSALLLTHYQTTNVKDSPALHFCEILSVIIFLLALSAVTWRWLGGKEGSSETAAGAKDSSATDSQQSK